MQEAMHIFDVLGLPEQVAYYQEHYEKICQRLIFPNKGKNKKLLSVLIQ